MAKRETPEEGTPEWYSTQLCRHLRDYAFPCAQSVQPYLTKRADLHVTDQYGQTPLMVAINRKLYDLAIYFIDRMTDVNQLDDNEGNVLFYCRDLDMMKRLVDKGANIYQHRSWGDTVLRTAAYFGKADIVEFLLKKSTQDLNFATESGETPLIVAAQRGEADTINVLLNYKADPRPLNWDGRTALQWYEQDNASDPEKAALTKRLRLYEYTEYDPATLTRVFNKGRELPAQKPSLIRRKNPNKGI